MPARLSLPPWSRRSVVPTLLFYSITAPDSFHEADRAGSSPEEAVPRVPIGIFTFSQLVAL